MSRLKIIGGASFFSLVLLGALAAPAQAGGQEPTELYVRTTPPGAAIAIDGKEVGTSPKLLKVEPGDHTVVVTLAGHDPLASKVTTPAGQITRLVLELKRRPEAAADATNGKSAAPTPGEISPRKRFSASLGAGGGILAMAFSPDGQTVATVDETGKVTLCTARSGRSMLAFDALQPDEKKLLLHEDRQGRIHTAAIAFSPDGRTLAVGADPVVRLYDAETGRPKLALEDKGLIEELKKIGGSISEELERLEAVPHAHGRVYSVAFSPDGKSLATSGSHLIRPGGTSVIDAEIATHGKVKVWDAKTGELQRDLGEHYSFVRSVAFSPDGKALASIGTHPPGGISSVRLWDPRTGAVQSELSIGRGGHPELVAFSPDGKLVAASAIVSEPSPPGGTESTRHAYLLVVWNARTGEPLSKRLAPEGVGSMSFSADSRTLATGGGQHATLWNPGTLEKTGEIAPSGLLAFSPVGSVLAIGGESERQTIVTVWEIGQPEDRRR